MIVEPRSRLDGAVGELVELATLPPGIDSCDASWEHVV